MNERMQELIIKEVGILGTIALLGTILVTCLFPDNTIVTTLLFGAVTSSITALVTFLNNKNMTEKQEETLTKYHLNKALNNNEEVTRGNMKFNTQEEMEEYLIKNMVNNADTTKLEEEDDVQ